MLKYFLLWLPMPLIAIVNAAIRQLLFVKNFGEKTAHQLSTVTIIIFLGIYIYLVLSKWRLESSIQALLVGLMWCFLTVIFEFSLGFATKQSFSEMIKSYDLLNGNLWVLVPLFMLLAPLGFYFLMQKGQ